MAEDDDTRITPPPVDFRSNTSWEGRFRDLEQRVNSWFNIMSRIFPDIVPGPGSDREMVIKIRSAISHAIENQERVGQIEDNFKFVNMILAMKDPTIYELLTFARKLMIMSDPSFEELMGMDKRQFKMEKPSWEEMTNFLRGAIAEKDEGRGNKREIIRLILALLGGLVSAWILQKLGLKGP